VVTASWCSRDDACLHRRDQDMPIGTSFQPGKDRGEAQSESAQARGRFQEAIRLLSLRFPKVVGAQAPAPVSLLTGPGSGGVNPDTALMQNLRQQMPAPMARGQSSPMLPPSPGAPSGPPSSGGPTISGASGGSSPIQQAVMSMARAPSLSGMPRPGSVPTPNVSTITYGEPSPYSRPGDLPRPKEFPPSPPVRIPPDGPITPSPHGSYQDQLPPPPMPSAPSPTTAPEPPMLNTQQMANEQIGSETDINRLRELLRLANQSYDPEG
jgi:hypothetical protein